MLEADLDEDARTIFCANLSSKVTEAILYELFLQGGPVERIDIPVDKDGKKKNFGFVVYAHACSVPYALELYAGTKLFDRALYIKRRINQPPVETNNHVGVQSIQQPHMSNLSAAMSLRIGFHNAVPNNLPPMTVPIMNVTPNTGLISYPINPYNLLTMGLGPNLGAQTFGVYPNNESASKEDNYKLTNRRDNRSHKHSMPYSTSDSKHRYKESSHHDERRRDDRRNYSRNIGHRKR